MPLRLLIVNADDLGISPGVNHGVLEAHQRGIVSGASLMSNQPWTEHAVDLCRAVPELGMGLHLALSCGRPVSPPAKVPSLIESDGRFRSLAFWLATPLRGMIHADEVRREVAAQIERALALGVHLDHLDAHHHLQALPLVGRVALDAARTYGIPAIRVPAEVPRAGRPTDTMRALSLWLRGRWLRRAARAAGLLVADHFAGVALGYAFSARALASELSRLRPGVTELMVHPGYPDEALRRATRYASGRERELTSLISETARRALQQVDASLTTWAAIAR